MGEGQTPGWGGGRERRDAGDGRGSRGAPQIRRWRRADRGAGFLFPALPPRVGANGAGGVLSPRPRPAAAHRRLEGRPTAATARLKGPGPESPCSRPSTRSRGVRSVRSWRKVPQCARDCYQVQPLQLRQGQSRSGPERPPPSGPLPPRIPAPGPADGGPRRESEGSSETRLVWGPSLCRWSLGVPALQIFPGAGVGGGDVPGGLGVEAGGRPVTAINVTVGPRGLCRRSSPRRTAGVCGDARSRLSQPLCPLVRVWLLNQKPKSS